MSYMLVTLQVRYGKVGEFVEIMEHLVPALEKEGWQLRGAWSNSIGRLNKVYDLWEIPDASHVSSVLEVVNRDPAFREWAEKLEDCLESEQLEVMEKLPYSPGAP